MSIIPTILCLLCYFQYIKYAHISGYDTYAEPPDLKTKQLQAFTGLLFTAMMLLGFVSFIGIIHDMIWLFEGSVKMECISNVTDPITSSIDRQLTN